MCGNLQSARQPPLEGVCTPAEKQRQTLTPHSTSDDSYLTKAEGMRKLN